MGWPGSRGSGGVQHPAFSVQIGFRNTIYPLPRGGGDHSAVDERVATRGAPDNGCAASDDCVCCNVSDCGA